MRFAISFVLLAVLAGAQTPPFVDVKRYGATGDGATLDTAAIRKAVDACAAAGGGTVYFPAGSYLSGTVFLKDNVTLLLDAGATLRGSPDLAHYRTAVDGQDWYDALILAKGVRNVAILGHGAIDGNRVFNPNGEEHMRGPHAALFYDCRNVTVRDISILDAANYALIFRATEGVNVDSVTVHGGWDGINMHDTRNATISNCRLFTGDDSLAGAYWENVTVTNCILNSSTNAMRVGGRNVLVSNSVIYGPGEAEHRTSQRHDMEAGFQVLPHRAAVNNKYVTPGPIDNMVLSDLTMVNLSTPVYIAYSADAAYSANNLGVGRILIRNLTVINAGKTPLYISAPPDNPAKSIVLDHVRMAFAGGVDGAQTQGQGYSPFAILRSYGIYGRNIENLELHDVRVDSVEKDMRPVLFGENIGTLELDRFPQRQSIQLDGIRHLIVDGKDADPAGVTVPHIARHVPPKPVGKAPQAPYRTFTNTTADLLQLQEGFYIRAGGEHPILQYGDQYGAIYRPGALGPEGVIIVRMENPDLRGSWGGRAGIMVRNDIAGPDQSPGYLILSSSPGAGTYLEWDADGNGRLDRHTAFEGNTLWPHWLKLERHGSRFVGYKSRDGKEWTKVDEAEVPTSGATQDAGIFAFRSSARFDRLEILSAPPPAPSAPIRH